MISGPMPPNPASGPAADLLMTNISQLATALGAGPKHGAAMRSLAIVEDAAIAIAGGRIVWVGERRDWTGKARQTVDAGGRAVVPGLVDPHTHAVWAGDRLADFDARTSGKSYEQILAAGGGIRSTVRATALASRDSLVELAAPRIQALVRSGATVIEVKSGYGFTVEAEIASLEAIQALATRTPAKILATLLLHLPPPDAAERSAYVDRVASELVPEVARRGLASAVDIFIEREAFQVAEAATVLQCAQAHGLGIKMHAEQFHSVGGVELALEMGALSVDHLEACAPAQCARFAIVAPVAAPVAAPLSAPLSAPVATILPGVSLHLGIPPAPGRGLIDAGAAVAVGTDLNPGSSPLFSTAMALGLAVRLNGLTAKEALVAGTVNAAAALGLEDAGRIEARLQADLLVLEDRDWRSLVYTLGANPVREVWIAGIKI